MGGLAQWLGKIVKGADTIFSVEYNDIPSKLRKCITYGRIVLGYYQQKEDPNRTRLTAGVNLSEYPGDVVTPTSDTATVMIVWNIVVSNPKYKNIYIDIKKHYLGKPITRHKYLCMSITLISDEIIQQYNLLPIVINGFIYLCIFKGMYGLTQAGRLENDLLTKSLASKGYFKCTHTHQDYGKKNGAPYYSTWW